MERVRESVCVGERVYVWDDSVYVCKSVREQDCVSMCVKVCV